MANNIKGITVEIGGDTTKLGKALEDVNKKSRDLSSELGQINKMLKFDPGNADLLAQKQKVLADAVSNTSKKLATLKAAEKQVQEQFKRGEVSEEQVRALQREIIATEKKMAGYEKAAKETAEQVKNLGKASKDAEDGTKKTKKGADQAADSLDEMADSADKAADASDGLGSKLGGLAKGGLQALAAGVTAAVGAMVASAEATREYRTEMGKLETAFESAGHSAEAGEKTYKRLQGILGETDQAVEAANHMAKLTDTEKELSTWTTIATGVYATFGASLPIENLAEASNETAKTGKITGGLADALNWAGESEEAFQLRLDACTSEQERQALIMDTLNGLYSDAANKYRETNAEVIRANEANEAWMASMADVGAAVEPVLTDIKLLGASLLSDLVPGIQDAAEAFRGMFNGDEGAAAKLGESLSGIFSQVLTKVTEVLPSVAEMAVSLITTLATSIIKSLPLLLETVVDVTLAVVNGFAEAIPKIVSAWTLAIPQLTQTLTASIPLLVEALAEAIPQLVQGAVQLFTSIVEAIPLIIPPLLLAIPQLVLSIVNALVMAVPQLITGAVQFLLAIVQAIPLIIPPIVEAIPQIVTTLVDCLITAIPLLLDGALQLFMAIVQAIPQVIPPIIAAIPQIITTLIDGLIIAVPQLIEGAVQLLNAIIEAIPILIDALIPEIPSIVETLIDELLRLTPVLLDSAITLLFAIVEAIPEIVTALVDNVPLILDAIISILTKLPELIWGILSQVLDRMASFVTNMASKALDAGQRVLTSVVDCLKQLPGKIWGFLQTTIDNVKKFGTEAMNKAKTAAKDIFDAVVNGIKGLPGKVLSIGSDLVKGLWNGISDMTGWITGKLDSFGDSVLSGIKDFFGIHSPSRVFKDEVGKMLAVGLAEGITASADKPLDAMAALSKDIMGEADEMNGLTLERKMQHTFSTPESFTAVETGVLEGLNQILAAIKQGQVIMLDSKTLVGATANQMDNALGQRRVLAARGAI